MKLCSGMAKNGVCPHKLLVLGVLSILANILLLISIFLLVIFVVRREDSTPEVTYLGVEGVVNETLNQITRETTKKRELEQIQVELSQYYGARKSACHLEPSIQAFTGFGGVQTLHWRAASESTFVEKGLNLKNGSVVVHTEGYYFIYSQIVYHGSGTEELDYGRIIHRIEKQKSVWTSKHSSPTPLLQNFLSTPSIRRGREVYRTSLLEGTFFLEENSIVSVLSSVPKNIDLSPLRTYYGLFLM